MRRAPKLSDVAYCPGRTRSSDYDHLKGRQNLVWWKSIGSRTESIGNHVLAQLCTFFVLLPCFENDIDLGFDLDGLSV